MFFFSSLFAVNDLVSQKCNNCFSHGFLCIVNFNVYSGKHNSLRCCSVSCFFSNAIISRLFYSPVFLFYRYALLSFVFIFILFFIILVCCIIEIVVQYLFCWFFFIVCLCLSRVFVKRWLTEITSVAVNVLSSKFFFFQQIISSDHLVLAYNSIYAIDVFCFFFVLFYRLK